MNQFDIAKLKDEIKAEIKAELKAKEKESIKNTINYLGERLKHLGVLTTRYDTL